jgi:DNA-binding XRE family transcriptional regulator
MTIDKNIERYSGLKTLDEVLEKRVGPFTFAMFMRSLRGLHDLTQSEAAKLLGISKGTLCDIEKGRQLVSPTLAKKIAKKFKYPEIVAIQASLQDQLRKAKVKYTVQLVA